MEEYKATAEETKLQARFTFDGSMHLWDLKDKALYLRYLNNRAGLPFGTIGMIRTEHKDKAGNVTVKEIPYASRQTTVELGRKHKISLEQVKEVISQERVVYTYRAKDIDTGRSVDAVGACSFMGWDKPLKEDQKCNKIMHAETKAKRRATLEVCGLAFLDETEVEDMENTTRIDVETGEVVKQDPKPKGNGSTAATASTPSVASASAPSLPAPSLPATPAPEPPKEAAGTPVAPPVLTVVPQSAPALPGRCPKRYAANVVLFTGEPTDIAASVEHINFIVAASKEAGWDGPTLSKWLFDTFGVRMANKDTTLTVEVFGKIMGGIDQALTSAGR